MNLKPSTKKKILHTLLLITSLFGYLEWGGNQHMFIFQVEIELFSKAIQAPESFLHPAILIPLSGQFILLYTLFQPIPGKILSFAGICGISLFMILLLFIGIISSNWKIIVSTIPYNISAIIAIRFYRKHITNR